MKIFYFILTTCLITSCANLKGVDSLNIEKTKDQLSGIYTVDPNISTEKADFPLKRYGFHADRESFEILFTKNDDLVIRSTNQEPGKIKYFEGKFKQNGVYEYKEKETEGILLINRSVRCLRLIVWKSPENGRLKIELKSKSSAQIFIFIANRTKKILTGTYKEIKAPNSK